MRPPGAKALCPTSDEPTPRVPDIRPGTARTRPRLRGRRGRGPEALDRRIRLLLGYRDRQGRRAGRPGCAGTASCRQPRRHAAPVRLVWFELMLHIVRECQEIGVGRHQVVVATAPHQAASPGRNVGRSRSPPGTRTDRWPRAEGQGRRPPRSETAVRDRTRLNATVDRTRLRKPTLRGRARPPPGPLLPATG